MDQLQLVRQYGHREPSITKEFILEEEDSKNISMIPMTMKK